MVVNKLYLLRERVSVVDLKEERAKAPKADVTAQRFIIQVARRVGPE